MAHATASHYHGLSLVMQGRECPYCGKETKYEDSSVVYGRSYGMMYRCAPCDAYVGVHKGSDIALGRLADAELRKWKKAVHARFDPIWKNDHLSRGDAYKWLALRMDLPVEKCHVGMFDVAQCRIACGLLEEWEFNQ